MKFHDSPIILHQQMLQDELSALGQNLAELREGPRQEIRFRLVVTGERMRAFDDPVDLIVYMLEKARAVALLKTLEDPSDVVFGNHNLLSVYMSYAAEGAWQARKKNQGQKNVDIAAGGVGSNGWLGPGVKR